MTDGTYRQELSAWGRAVGLDPDGQRVRVTDEPLDVNYCVDMSDGGGSGPTTAAPPTVAPRTPIDGCLCTYCPHVNADGGPAPFHPCSGCR